MMQEDREKAIKYFKMRLAEKTHPPTTAQQRAFTAALEALQEPEREKGQWIILSSDKDRTVCKCPVCEEIFSFYSGEFATKYCGECGTDMRGSENDRKRV